MPDRKRAILVVSFGTLHGQTREKTIDRIEAEIGREYPGYGVYRAWTSEVILKRLREKENIHYDTIREALERMLADGVREAVVQPTHLIDGLENERMVRETAAYAGRFERIVCGKPILSDVLDGRELVQAVMREFPGLAGDEALVFMGHGTARCADSIYTVLNDAFCDLGFDNAYVGTMEGTLSLESVMRRVEKEPYRKIHLVPLLFVAGKHAKKDMAGGEGSWRARFAAAGYEVECHIRGLGEYAGIRGIILRHIREALEPYGIV